MHQRALLRNLACALILTELKDEDKADVPGTGREFIQRVASLTPPKVPGRIVTTLAKAKEVQPLLEKCITIACRALPHQEAADRLEPDADRDSQEWQDWRNSQDWHEWNRTVVPAVTTTVPGWKEYPVIATSISPAAARTRKGGVTTPSSTVAGMSGPPGNSHTPT